ncbi:hypothetical protein NA57DRAFT_72430 [Rhizodiscina lignyota]|uniref:Uncharacterized protein n=1 Tax=Rhizodiscina lignyota TaxID=1504668 RepID=A0A9P4IQE5_9PEZI|nr:hypothetical protein NA57DRAFT_72430 [Rhizodiscina lignyota]
MNYIQEKLLRDGITGWVSNTDNASDEQCRVGFLQLQEYLVDQYHLPSTEPRFAWSRFDFDQDQLILRTRVCPRLVHLSVMWLEDMNYIYKNMVASIEIARIGNQLGKKAFREMARADFEQRSASFRRQWECIQLNIKAYISTYISPVKNHDQSIAELKDLVNSIKAARTRVPALWNTNDPYLNS